MKVVSIKNMFVEEYAISDEWIEEIENGLDLY
mgnify:CR=1 FL=1